MELLDWAVVILPPLASGLIVAAVAEVLERLFYR